MPASTAPYGSSSPVARVAGSGGAAYGPPISLATVGGAGRAPRLPAGESPPRLPPSAVHDKKRLGAVDAGDCGFARAEGRAAKVGGSVGSDDACFSQISAATATHAETAALRAMSGDSQACGPMIVGDAGAAMRAAAADADQDVDGDSSDSPGVSTQQFNAPTTPVISVSGSGSVPHLRSEDKSGFLRKYEMGTKLGRGAFGTVRMVTARNTRDIFACKTIIKNAKGGAPMVQIDREVEVMKLMNLKHVVKLYEVYETPKQIFLVMEYCNGGELVKKVQLLNSVSETDIKLIIRRLSEVVGYMHDHGIVHRDIKPQNILLSTQDPDDPYNIKVSDFGLATVSTGGKLMENVCGTPLYMAPEVVAGLGYSHSCDIWSIGVMMGLLLANFTKDAESEFREMVNAGSIRFSHKMWKHCTPLATSLLERMLQSDPANRISAKEVLGHPWITGNATSADKVEQKTVLEMMRRYRSELRWKRVTYAIIAVNRFLLFSQSKITSSNSNDLATSIEKITVTESAGSVQQKRSASLRQQNSLSLHGPSPNAEKRNTPSASSQHEESRRGSDFSILMKKRQYFTGAATHRQPLSMATRSQPQTLTTKSVISATPQSASAVSGSLLATGSLTAASHSSASAAVAGVSGSSISGPNINSNAHHGGISKLTERNGSINSRIHSLAKSEENVDSRSSPNSVASRVASRLKK